MKLQSYLELMSFPREWTEWNMVPLELIAEQMKSYELGMENASEHDRHGAFAWWLRQELDAAQLVQLVQLSWLDPDEHLGSFVREAIVTRPIVYPEVIAALSKL